MTTLRDAAWQILERADGPLSVEEITARAQEQGLLNSTSKTPSASVGAALYLDIKNNSGSPFVQTGPKQFSLRPGIVLNVKDDTGHGSRDFAKQVDKHNRLVKEKLRATLGEMDPKAFEYLIGRLLERLGYEGVEVTKYSGDGGVDVKATLTVGGVTKVQTAVQVKRYGGNVSGKVVRELRGSLGVHERGLIMTTGGFSKDALVEAAYANKVPISLVDGNKLVDLLVQKRLGIVGKTVEIFDLDLASLDQVEGEATVGPGTKYQTLWPLPGGDYLAALNRMVEYIGAESPSMDTMIDWIKVTFPLVGSSKVAVSYTKVLRYGGLIQYDGSQLFVTEAGALYLSHPTNEFLLDLFKGRFLGLLELLEILRVNQGSLDQVHRDLVKRIGVQWSTTAQTRFRLEWLRALGVAGRSPAGLWASTQ